jgi:flagellar biosynthesis/type III secretory pathway protein FliH
MAEKNFLSWLGFKDQTDSASARPAEAKSAGSGTASSGPSHSLDRIRQLEAELADLRARRDITSLTREEFEILATETAMTLIKTAQAREARAVAAAERALGEAARAVKQMTDTAESKAHAVLQSAEGRGRKYLEAAEREAKEAITNATQSAKDLLEAKSREASSITSAAHREAERAIAQATSDIADYRSWLSGAIAESERLQKIHNQALTAAEEAVRQTRSKITSAFERLTALGETIENALDNQNRPTEEEIARVALQSASKVASVKKTTTNNNSAKTSANRLATTRKSVGNKPKHK